MARRRGYYNSSPKFTDSEILENFCLEAPAKTVFGNYRIEENRLIYRAQSSVEVTHWTKGDEDDFKKSKKEIGAKIKEHDGRLVDEKGKVVMLESLTKDSQSYKMRVQYYETNLVATKVILKNAVGPYNAGTTLCIGNSSTLPLVGRTVAYGNVSENSGTAEIQKSMQNHSYTMLPLNDFSECDFETFELLEKGEREAFTVKKKADYYDKSEEYTQKFSGSMLFKLEGTTYLYDVDRREIKHRFFNRFITEVDSNCVTIEGAYEFLKPKEVVNAEKSGQDDIKRQGNWFFIPTKAPAIPKLTIDETILILGAKASYDLDEPTIAYLTGKNIKRRDDAAEKLLLKVPRERKLTVPGANSRILSVETCIVLDGVTYCTGKISSDNRANLKLSDWHIAVKKGA